MGTAEDPNSLSVAEAQVEQRGNEMVKKSEQSFPEANGSEIVKDEDCLSLAEARVRIEALERENEQLKTSQTNLATAIVDARTMPEMLEKEAGALKDSMKDFVNEQARIQTLDRENEDLKAKLVQAQARMQTLTQDVERLQASLTEGSHARAGRAGAK